VAAVAPLVNQHAQRQEYISRKYYRDFANWAPYWMPQEPTWFLDIQRNYLKDVWHILHEYKIIMASKCAEMPGEGQEKKKLKLKEFENEYCANFKGKLKIEHVGLTWTCNSWGVELGQGLLGELEMNYGEDGSFEEFTLAGGLGAELDLYVGNIATLEAGASAKAFIKVGPNKATDKWELKDFGVKGEIAVEGSSHGVHGEVKLIESSVSVNAGVQVGGIVAPILPLK